MPGSSKIWFPVAQNPPVASYISGSRGNCYFTSSKQRSRQNLRHVAALNTLRATASRSTIFVETILHQDESRIVRKVIRLCIESAIRCWIKAACARYPTHSYLNRINSKISLLCPFCTLGVKESFSHFTAVCPQFREARTAAHNQLREKISGLLQMQLAELGGWKLAG